MKRILLALLFSASMFLLPNIAKRLTQGFRIAKMQLEFPFRAEWEISPISSVYPILTQPFHFLGKGAQSYVFESADGQYVVKLFRYDHPSSKDKIVHLFNACKMAYDFLQEETGLVYIHLNPTPMHLPIFHCKDAIGRRYKIPLDQARFAVQKKGKVLRDVLEAARGHPLVMQKRIDAFLDLLKARTAKQIINTDPSLSRNFGFLGEQAIEIDFGNYHFSPNINQIAEIKRFTTKLHKWLSENDPESVPYLEKRLQELQ